jgi:hypothetical protein
MEEQLIFEIWDTFRDNIPEKGRDTAAAQFVDFLVNKDVDAEALESLLGYDPNLDSAIGVVLAEFRDDGEIDDDDDRYNEEDEDY